MSAAKVAHCRACSKNPGILADLYLASTTIFTNPAIRTGRARNAVSRLKAGYSASYFLYYTHEFVT
jgi:hypothetical protein